MPIILCFVRPKCPSGNCYASCYVTEKTPLLIQNSAKTKSDGSIGVPWPAGLFIVLLMLGLKYKTKKKTYLVKRVDALNLEFISKML